MLVNCGLYTDRTQWSYAGAEEQSRCSRLLRQLVWTVQPHCAKARGHYCAFYRLLISPTIGNNNNNNNNSKTMFMVLSSWQSHCESSPGSFDKCRTAPSGRRPKTKPDDLGSESACTGCQNLHPPSPYSVQAKILRPRPEEQWYAVRLTAWQDR